MNDPKTPAQVLRFKAVLDEQPPFESEDGTRCACRELDGYEAPMGDPSWATRSPPLHPGCRCVLEVARDA